MSGAHTAPSRIQLLATSVRWPGIGRSIARTAGFNVASTAAAGLGGIILARAVGPTVRGEYAAITAWFGIALMVGGMGQPAALCFYVARDPLRAREYVATSRAMMLTTGTIALVAGILLAPLLAHGIAAVSLGYRIAFGTFDRGLRRGELYVLTAGTRPAQVERSAGQPARAQRHRHRCAVAARLLTLDIALVVLVRDHGAAAWLGLRVLPAHQPGTRPVRAPLVRPLAAYGAAQIAALTPAALNAQLDQLVLSQTVSPADLGRYAIAVSLTLLPLPFVSAIGNVAFPRLAAQARATAATHRMQRMAVLGSAGLAAAMLVPLAAVAYWLVPLVFGVGYRGAVPLLWILTPGAVFLACGQVTGDLLRGRNQPIFVAWAEGLAAVFTVVCSLPCCPSSAWPARQSPRRSPTGSRWR